MHIYVHLPLLIIFNLKFIFTGILVPLDSIIITFPIKLRIRQYILVFSEHFLFTR